MAKFTAGKAICRQPSTLKMLRGIPNTVEVGPRPEAGSQPNHTENKSIKTIPCQKLGNENPNMDVFIMLLPTQSSLYSPAIRPKDKPKIQVNVMATTTSSGVAGKRCNIKVTAGIPCTKEVPRSPCRARHKKIAYCSQTGLSSPSRATIASRCSWLTSGLTSSSIGSPTV